MRMIGAENEGNGLIRLSTLIPLEQDRRSTEVFSNFFHEKILSFVNLEVRQQLDKMLAHELL